MRGQGVTSGPGPGAGDPADAWSALTARLAGTRFADVRHVAETGSTNADVLALARAGASEGVVLVADHQTAGRGRRDRRWEDAPGGSLLVSVLTRPSQLGLARGHVHLVPMATGVAAAEAARARTGADVRLKWPNDLVVEDGRGTRKVSGLLAESVVAGGALEALVVGIGINVNWPGAGRGGAGVPDELAATATALNRLAGGPVDRVALLEGLLRGLDRIYAGLVTPAGRAGLRHRYRELSATVGRRVRVETPAGDLVGEALDVDGAGRLLVATGAGAPTAVAVGDVVHVRPAP